MKLAKRMPALFVGHGSPLTAFEENPYVEAWKGLGAVLLCVTGAEALYAGGAAPRAHGTLSGPMCSSKPWP